MVVPLGPGKFYGSSLPRPWIYTDVKLNDERVDPPLPVMDPLISWANEAHWSMGGLSFKRHRLQGRIEGNVNKLRVQLEKELFKKSENQKKPIKGSAYSERRFSETSETPSPPPAPVAIKRRRVVGLVEEEEVHTGTKRGPVRKLGDDFERVARESGMPAKGADNNGDGSGAVAGRTRSKRNGADVVVDEVTIKKGKKKLFKGGRRIGAAVLTAVAGLRTSPRLAKQSG
ncbi:uncharacterized protein [Primulina huaijiensis]|uniref:uncharacterized protein n=1 Tax=Primulina huaijiensis TaxID=1492673 RepID=UPI003CC799C0